LYENAKKSVAGLADPWLLLGGENSRVNNDLNVKTVVFYLRKIALVSASIIVLFGLKNGYSNGRPIKL
jgi:hypothetical protein